MNIDIISNLKVEIAKAYKTSKLTKSDNNILSDAIINSICKKMHHFGFVVKFSINNTDCNKISKDMSKIIEEMGYDINTHKITVFCKNIIKHRKEYVNNKLNNIKVIILWNGVNTGITVDIKIVYKLMVIIVEYYRDSIVCKYVHVNCKEIKPSYCAISTIDVFEIKDNDNLSTSVIDAVKVAISAAAVTTLLIPAILLHYNPIYAYLNKDRTSIGVSSSNDEEITINKIEDSK